MSEQTRNLYGPTQPCEVSYYSVFKCPCPNAFAHPVPPHDYVITSTVGCSREGFESQWKKALYK